MRGFLFLIAAIGVGSSLLGGALTRSPGKEMAIEEKLDSGGYRLVGDSEGSTTSSDGTVELERSADGHFYAEVEINGETVRALVDTGATGIALSREDARSAGLATSIGMNEVIGRGADGDVRGEFVTLDRVTLGHKTAENMPAIVLSSGEQSLLGQSFLSKFDSVEITGDTMRLR